MPPRRDLTDRDSWNWRGMRAKAESRERVYDRSHRDHELAEIYREQGFHAKPELVDRERMDALIRDGATPIYRGIVQTSNTPDLDGMVKSFQEGDEHYAGIGVYGNGTYFSPHVAMAQRYADTEDRREQPRGAVLRAVLKPDARVIDYDELRRRQAEAMFSGQSKKLNDDIFARLEQVGDSDPERTKALVEELRAENRRLAETYDKGWDDLISDAGRYAAMLGYDAIAAGPTQFYLPDDGGKYHTVVRYGEVVVLNRGALVVDRSPARRVDDELRLFPRRDTVASLGVEGK